MTLDAATVRAALAEATDSTDPADVRLELAPAVVPPTVTTDDAEARGGGRTIDGRGADARDPRRARG